MQRTINVHKKNFVITFSHQRYQLTDEQKYKVNNLVASPINRTKIHNNEKEQGSKIIETQIVHVASSRKQIC